MASHSLKIKAEEAVTFFNERLSAMDEARQEFVNLFEEDEKLFRYL